jgi:glucosamine kinase
MILIAESGSTKTDWVLLVDGQKTQYFTTIGLNPYFVSGAQIEVEFSKCIVPSLHLQLRHIYFYGTGITDATKANVVSTSLTKALGYSPNIHCHSDVVAAARALWGMQKGIACILGTGSNSCFWHQERIDFQVPPLGFWLGDEGSGGHLGKMLLLDYLHREMPQNIRDLFEMKYGQKDRIEILKMAYQVEKPNRYFAEFAPFIHENLTDRYCTSMVKNSFEAFFQKYLLKYPMLSSEGVGFVGSIAFYFQDILKEVCQIYGIRLSKIVEKPIHELVKFHQE